MAVVNSKEMLEKARANRYAVCAFNFSNLEQLKAIIEVAEKLDAPVIVQASPSAVEYMGLNVVVAMVKAECENKKTDVCLNLDHGLNADFCKRAIDAGFTNIMIDLSSKTIDENIEGTAKIVRYAHERNVTVEAELGSLKGKEDNVENRESLFTNPDEAKIFVLKTKADSLAVSIGTSHGAYKFSGESSLDIPRLKEINKAINLPIVLHGASGIDPMMIDEFLTAGGAIRGAKGVSDNDILDAIENGVCKINIDTDLRISFTTGVRKALKDATVFNPRTYLSAGMEEMKKTVTKKILLYTKRV